MTDALFYVEGSKPGATEPGGGEEDGSAGVAVISALGKQGWEGFLFERMEEVKWEVAYGEGVTHAGEVHGEVIRPCLGPRHGAGGDDTGVAETFGVEKVVLSVLGARGGLPAAEGLVALIGRAGGNDVGGGSAVASDENVGTDLTWCEARCAVGVEQVEPVVVSALRELEGAAGGPKEVAPQLGVGC